MRRHTEVDSKHPDDENRAVNPRKMELSYDHLGSALVDAHVYVFYQDMDLRYVGAFGPNAEKLAVSLVGRTDDELLPSRERETVVAIKLKVLRTGIPADCEV